MNEMATDSYIAERTGACGGLRPANPTHSQPRRTAMSFTMF